MKSTSSHKLSRQLKMQMKMDDATERRDATLSKIRERFDEKRKREETRKMITHVRPLHNSTDPFLASY
jgi:hypothetical protein